MILKKHKLVDLIIFLAGFFSFASGFYFKVGAFHVRLYDLFFYLLIFSSALATEIPFIKKKEIKGLLWILTLFLWLFINGAFNVLNVNSDYSDFFIKYFINKIFWIPFYAFLYFYYRERLIYYFFLGLCMGLTFNALMVIGEFVSIFHGLVPQYKFLNIIGLFVDPKKGMIINQDMIRPSGMTLDPNYTGGYGGIGIILWEYFKFKDNWNSKLVFLMQTIIIISVALIFSRTGLFSFILTYLISLYLYIFYGKKKKYKPLATNVFWVLLIGASVLLIYLNTSDPSYFNILFNRLNAKDSSAGTRIDYLNIFFQKANLKDELFGVGTSQSGFWLGKTGDFSNSFVEIWSPESNIITYVIEEGLVFVFLFLFSIWVYVKKLIKIEYFFGLLLIYINLIGFSYNFLGDRLYYFITVILVLYTYKTYYGEDYTNRFNRFV